jgi:thioredoxin reductase (NADPH)
LKCHVIDVLDKPGGQCAELYPEKPIYDIPAFPVITGQALTDNLLEQIKPFDAQFHFGHLVNVISKQTDGMWLVQTDRGLLLKASVIVIAAGGGSFTPKKPPIGNIENFENISVFYAVRDKKKFVDRDIVIVGGGDSAIDWTLDLYSIARSTTLIHRRDDFRAAPHSITKMKELVAAQKIKFLTGQVSALQGQDGQLDHIHVTDDDNNTTEIPCQILLPFFGLTMKLGPVADFGLNLHENRIAVDTEKFETSVPSIFAVGDINTYPGKLKLILSGFHEAALAAQAAYRVVYPEKKLRFEYTTSSTAIHKKLGLKDNS